MPRGLNDLDDASVLSFQSKPDGEEDDDALSELSNPDEGDAKENKDINNLCQQYIKALYGTHCPVKVNRDGVARITLNHEGKNLGIFFKEDKGFQSYNKLGFSDKEVIEFLESKLEGLEKLKKVFVKEKDFLEKGVDKVTIYDDGVAAYKESGVPLDKAEMQRFLRRALEYRLKGLINRRAKDGLLPNPYSEEIKIGSFYFKLQVEKVDVGPSRGEARGSLRGTEKSKFTISVKSSESGTYSEEAFDGFVSKVKSEQLIDLSKKVNELIEREEKLRKDVRDNFEASQNIELQEDDGKKKTYLINGGFGIQEYALSGLVGAILPIAEEERVCKALIAQKNKSPDDVYNNIVALANEYYKKIHESDGIHNNEFCYILRDDKIIDYKESELREDDLVFRLDNIGYYLSKKEGKELTGVKKDSNLENFLLPLQKALINLNNSEKELKLKLAEIKENNAVVMDDGNKDYEELFKLLDNTSLSFEGYKPLNITNDGLVILLSDAGDASTRLATFPEMKQIHAALEKQQNQSAVLEEFEKVKKHFYGDHLRDNRNTFYLNVKIEDKQYKLCEEKTSSDPLKNKIHLIELDESGVEKDIDQATQDLIKNIQVEDIKKYYDVIDQEKEETISNKDKISKFSPIHQFIEGGLILLDSTVYSTPVDDKPILNLHEMQEVNATIKNIDLVNQIRQLTPYDLTNGVLNFNESGEKFTVNAKEELSYTNYATQFVLEGKLHPHLDKFKEALEAKLLTAEKQKQRSEVKKTEFQGFFGQISRNNEILSKFEAQSASIIAELEAKYNDALGKKDVKIVVDGSGIKITLPSEPDAKFFCQASDYDQLIALATKALSAKKTPNPNPPPPVPNTGAKPHISIKDEIKEIDGKRSSPKIDIVGNDLEAQKVEYNGKKYKLINKDNSESLQIKKGSNETKNYYANFGAMCFKKLDFTRDLFMANFRNCVFDGCSFEKMDLDVFNTINFHPNCQFINVRIPFSSKDGDKRGKRQTIGDDIDEENAIDVKIGDKIHKAWKGNLVHYYGEARKEGNIMHVYPHETKNHARTISSIPDRPGYVYCQEDRKIYQIGKKGLSLVEREEEKFKEGVRELKGKEGDKVLKETMYEDKGGHEALAKAVEAKKFEEFKKYDKERKEKEEQEKARIKEEEPNIPTKALETKLREVMRDFDYKYSRRQERTKSGKGAFDTSSSRQRLNGVSPFTPSNDVENPDGEPLDRGAGLGVVNNG